MTRINQKLLIVIVALILFYFPKFKSDIQNVSLPAPTPNVIQISPTPTSNSNLYKVVKVVDGDTITVKIDNKNTTIRLIGIDTPEVVDPRKPVQCFGREASAKTKQLLDNKNVLLESDSTQGDKDKYSRLLRYVRLEDGTFVNQKLIKDGYAFEYTYNLPYKYQDEFKQAQKQAEENSLGLWDPNTCPVK